MGLKGSSGSAKIFGDVLDRKAWLNLSGQNMPKDKPLGRRVMQIDRPARGPYCLDADGQNFQQQVIEDPITREFLGRKLNRADESVAVIHTK
jgi:hypothetical protein